MAPPKSKGKRAQAQGGILAQAERHLRNSRIQLQKAEQKLKNAHTPGAKRRAQRAVDEAQAAETVASIQSLLTVGTYSPVTPPPPTVEGLRAWLTPSRRRAIAAAERETQRLRQESVFAPFTPKITKEDRRKIRDQASQIGAKVTKAGIFVQRERREIKQPEGVLQFEKSTGLFKVRVKKTFETDDGFKTKSIDMYIAGTAALEAAEAKMQKLYNGLQLKPGQEMRFMIQGRNVSHSSFRTMAALLEYARGYRQSTRAQATFISSLTVMVFERDENGLFTRPVGRVSSSGRVRPWTPDDETQEQLEDYFERRRDNGRKRSKKRDMRSANKG